MKQLAILGSTGSIGKQTLDIIRQNREAYSICSITANSSLDVFEQQINEFRPKVAVLADEVKYKEFKSKVKSGTELLTGTEGLIYAAVMDEVDIVVSSIVGVAGLIPTYNAVKKGKTIALANKETLVTAGKIIKKAAQEAGAVILPVDSEHSAIFQSIGNNNPKNIHKLILTASGGPFRNFSAEKLKSVTLEEALNHPNWSMGSKITIDSATLMNKGLEVIEAKWLFDVEADRIQVCVHPQSIIHSMVEFVDGAVIAQLGLPDMKIPIQYALTYPDRFSIQGRRLNLTEIKTLDFYEPDTVKFPCLRLAYEALKAGDSACVVLNGANEQAVKLFMEKKISFTDISTFIEAVLHEHVIKDISTIEEVMDLDFWSRRKVNDIYETRCHI